VQQNIVCSQVSGNISELQFCNNHLTWVFRADTVSRVILPIFKIATARLLVYVSAAAIIKPTELSM